MTKPRIQLCVTNDLTHDRRMIRICQSLSSAGFSCELIGRELKESQPIGHFDFEMKRLKCFFRKGPAFYIEFNLRLILYMISNTSGILCACDLDTVPAIWFVSRLRNVKTVYDAHEYFTEVPELSGRWIKKSIWKWIARVMIPSFDVCYTVGEELATIMGAKYGQQFYVVRNIAKSENIVTEIPVFSQRQKSILYQGAINVGRGLPELILAMKNLPEWTLRIAGRGDIDEQLKKLIELENLSDRVHLLGWVAPDQIPALLNNALISVNLREAGSLNDYYSLPNKFFDTMQAGVPSVNMRYPEYESVIRKFPAAVLIDEISTGSIIHAIEEIAKSEETWSRMSQAGIDAARYYTWEKDEALLIRLFRNLHADIRIRS